MICDIDGLIIKVSNQSRMFRFKVEDPVNIQEVPTRHLGFLFSWNIVLYKPDPRECVLPKVYDIEVSPALDESRRRRSICLYLVLSSAFAILL
jgi:hypothetical protein